MSLGFLTNCEENLKIQWNSIRIPLDLAEMQDFILKMRKRWKKLAMTKELVHFKDNHKVVMNFWLTNLSSPELWNLSP